MIEVPTLEVIIWLGLQEGYSGPIHTIEEVEAVCQKYVDSVGLCVSIQESIFVYTLGKEPGVRIGLMNYPRFPSTRKEMIKHAFSLGKILVNEFRQHRCSIVFPDKTFLIESDDVKDLTN